MQWYYKAYHDIACGSNVMFSSHYHNRRQWSGGQQNHEVLETNAGSMSSPFEIDVYGTNKLLLLV